MVCVDVTDTILLMREVASMIVGFEEMQALEHDLTVARQTVVLLTEQNANLKDEVESLKKKLEFGEEQEKHFIRIPNGYKISRIEMIPIEYVSVFGESIIEKGENL